MTTYTLSEEQFKQLLTALDPSISMLDAGMEEAFSVLQSLQPNTQEPVIWRHEDIYGNEVGPPTLLYKHQAPQASLTDAQIDAILNTPFHADGLISTERLRMRSFARAIEAALGVKS